MDAVAMPIDQTRNETGTAFEVMDDLHLQYEELLSNEIQKFIGLAIAHGYRGDPSMYEKGLRIREQLRALGSKMPPENEIINDGDMVGDQHVPPV